MPALIEHPVDTLDIPASRPLTQAVGIVRATPSAAADLWDLTKPGIAFSVVLSALAGFLLGSPAGFDWPLLLHTLLGTGLTAAGSGALNHAMEWRHDAKMKRTALRPLPTHRLGRATASVFGCSLALLGTLWLFFFVNVLTAGLAALTIALYLLVYTPLKRYSKWNTLIGTVPGALPALGGFTAATGEAGAVGWAIFTVMALWQMPHFLALAWMYRKDYEKAGFQMLTVVEPDGRSTSGQTFVFTVLLVAASLLPLVLGAASWLYGAGVLALGAYFLRPAWKFYRTRSAPDARRVLIASVLYLPLLVGLIVVDFLF